MPIYSKLYICFGHGLKVCLWVGYSPQIIFVSFSQVLKLSHLQALLLSVYVNSVYLVYVTPPTVLYRFFILHRRFWSRSEDVYVEWIYTQTIKLRPIDVYVRSF